jgi:hypothetical protein
LSGRPQQQPRHTVTVAPGAEPAVSCLRRGGRLALAAGLPRGTSAVSLRAEVAAVVDRGVEQEGDVVVVEGVDSGSSFPGGGDQAEVAQ